MNISIDCILKSYSIQYFDLYKFLLFSLVFTDFYFYFLFFIFYFVIHLSANLTSSFNEKFDANKGCSYNFLTFNQLTT